MTSADPPRPGPAGRGRVRPALLVTIDDVRAGKPDPEGYLLAARGLGADPRRSWWWRTLRPRSGRPDGRRRGRGAQGRRRRIRIADLHQLTELLRQAENPRA